jgi:alternate signal-mediated exported protein
MKNKKKVTALIAGLLAVALIGGIWAYYSSTTTLSNEFKTKEYGSETREKFSPPCDWQPGQEIDKELKVKNTGDYELFVRIKMNETWTRSGLSQSIASTQTNFLPTTTTTALQLNPTDGLVAGDGSVVYKNLVNQVSPTPGTPANNWTFNPADGYWYYNQKLAAGSTTALLLESVTLCLDTDMGHMITTYYYTTAATEPADTNIGSNPATQWVTYTGAVPTGTTFTRSVSALDPTAMGYASATYTLDITTEVIQATAEARDAAGWAVAFTPAP